MEDRFSLGPNNHHQQQHPQMNHYVPSSLGSGTYQFLALTGTQQSVNSNKNRKQNGKYARAGGRMPNYSNEDLVDDLSRGQNNQFNSQDEICFDDFAEGAELMAANQSGMMEELDYS